MLRLLLLTALTTSVMVRPAAAFWINHNDGTYTYVPDGLFLVAILFVIGIMAGASSGLTSSPPPAKTADEYNAEAVVLAAKRHHTDMMTELRKAEIEAARVDAIHKERDEIIAHDKKVRDLNARLDQNRRAS
jgi:hypothetical protein